MTSSDKKRIEELLYWLDYYTAGTSITIGLIAGIIYVTILNIIAGYYGYFWLFAIALLAFIAYIVYRLGLYKIRELEAELEAILDKYLK